MAIEDVFLVFAPLCSKTFANLPFDIANYPKAQGQGQHYETDY